MKSAYELAMERLDRESPQNSPRVTDEQKAALADIDRVYEAKLAEKELFLKGQLATASPDERPAIEEQLRRERERIKEERESKKEKIRHG